MPVTAHRKIDIRQIRKIHALKNALNMPDEDYRAMVMDIHGFSITSKDLDYDEAEELSESLESLAVAQGVWVKYKGKKKYDELSDRQGMASPKQLRMIEAMWKEVSKYRDEKDRARALRIFLQRHFGISDLRFLEDWQVKKVKRALENMRRKACQR